MSDQQRLRIVPYDLATANALVKQWHRHHQSVQTHKWSLAVEDETGRCCGVAIANRPAAILLDDGLTIEVARLATDGTANACSCLYGAMKRVATAMGYERIITYTLVTEPGTSLRAAGWSVARTNQRPDTWNRPNIGRIRDGTEHMSVAKQRWDCWLVPEGKRRPRVKPIFGAPLTLGTLFEQVGT